MEALWVLVIHGEAGFAQLVYQVLNVTLVVRLRQALIDKGLLLVLTLWSLDSGHTTGGTLIHQTGLILPVGATAFLGIKVAAHLTTAREAVKVWHHRRIRLRLLLVLFWSWSTTRFEKKISNKLRKMTY